MPALPRSSESFIRLVQERLHRPSPTTFTFNANGDLSLNSAVLFLLGTSASGEPFLILNKRSQRVRQAGDLCCPGGGIAPSIDRLLARWLNLPRMPLSRWPHGSWWRRYRKADFPKLALLLAAALREGFEEMRLNPLGVRFLGPMPAQHLVMFKRAIYPMVGWVNHQQRFFPNWEVEKIVTVFLWRRFLTPPTMPAIAFRSRPAPLTCRTCPIGICPVSSIAITVPMNCCGAQLTGSLNNL